MNKEQGKLVMFGVLTGLKKAKELFRQVEEGDIDLYNYMSLIEEEIQKVQQELDTK